jgi:hypothetical protein
MCLVMKRYEESLSKRIRDGVDAPEIRRIVHLLFQTLEQLHAAGLVVKDIKPDNVLFDKMGRPHIADFGISVVLTRATRVVPTSISGTFNYLAPEAYDDSGFGVEVDIWAMGCLVTEMCTGEMPWARLQIQQIMNNVVAKRKAPEVPDYAPEADSIRRCFLYDPKLRPTAVELAEKFRPEAAEPSARKDARLARELDALKHERDAAKQERDEAIRESRVTRQELDLVRRELQAERDKSQSMKVERDAAVARALAAEKDKAVALGKQAVFEVTAVSPIDEALNGLYAQNGTREGRPRYCHIDREEVQFFFLERNWDLMTSWCFATDEESSLHAGGGCYNCAIWFKASQREEKMSEFEARINFGRKERVTCGHIETSADLPPKDWGPALKLRYLE